MEGDLLKKIKRLLLCGIVLLLGLTRCQNEERINEGQSPDKGILFSTITSESVIKGIPGGVDTLEIIVYDKDGNIIIDELKGVVGLEDINGDGNREIVIGELPYDEPLSIVIILKEGRTSKYLARTDGVVLKKGKRRFLELTFTPLNEVIQLPERFPYGFEKGIFGAQATLLKDGRVLITGGFEGDGRVNATRCPDNLKQAKNCIKLEATNKAYIFDPGSLKLYKLSKPMLEKRALHTATLLPDGRVLIAGGVDGAYLGFVPIEDPQARDTPGYNIRFVPIKDEQHKGALPTFEIFDPELNAELIDYRRDGDIAKGGFLGAASQPELPGNLNMARFLHSAVLIKEDEGKVLIIGGEGEEEAKYTGELFDINKPGGYGVYDNTGFYMHSPDDHNGRVHPILLSKEGSVWIIGGAIEGNSLDDILDVWQQEGSINGTFIQPQCGELFSSLSESELKRLFFWYPKGAFLGADKRYIFVNGWLGIICDTTNSSQVQYPTEGGGICKFDNGSPDQSFIIDTMECKIYNLNRGSNPYLSNAHALGTVDTLPDGRVILIGGIGKAQEDPLNKWLYANTNIDILPKDVHESGIMDTPNSKYNLNTLRIMHSSVVLKGGRVVVFGGFHVTRSTPETPEGIYYKNTIEVINLGEIKP